MQQYQVYSFKYYSRLVSCPASKLTELSPVCHPEPSEQRERSLSGALLRRPERSEGAHCNETLYSVQGDRRAVVSDSFTLWREAGTNFCIRVALHYLFEVI